MRGSVCVAKKGILRDKRDFWSVLQQVEKHASDAVDITTSVREMPHIKCVILVQHLSRTCTLLIVHMMLKCAYCDYYNFFHASTKPQWITCVEK